MYRTLRAIAMALLPIVAQAADDRPANIKCNEYGQIAEEMTSLLTSDNVPTILQRMSEKYPASAQYVPEILQVVLTPPIISGPEIHVQITRACMRQFTHGV